MVVPWIMKIYCNLIREEGRKNDWDEYLKFQKEVLQKISENKGE